MNPRTCLATNQNLPVEQLQRFTIQDGSLIFDRNVKNPGRGGYFVRDKNIVAKLPKLKGKINYKLNFKGALVIPEEELDWFESQCK